MDKAAPNVKKPSMAKDDRERQARLAEALRTNLRRRKAQARAVGEEAAGTKEAATTEDSAEDQQSTKSRP